MTVSELSEMAAFRDEKVGGIIDDTDACFSFF
jgi:hypothetical protein